MREAVRVLAQSVALCAITLALAGSAAASSAQPAQTPAKAPSASTAPGQASAPSAVQTLFGELTPPIVAGLLLLVAIVFAFLLVVEVSRGGPVAIESFWGGFGGGIGGWRLSPGLVYLIVMIFFGAMSSMAVMRIITPANTSDATSSPPSKDDIAGQPSQGTKPTTPAETAAGAAATSK